MKKHILILFLCFIGFINYSKATHIIGGELQMTFVTGTATNGTYRFNLNMYWDRVSNIKDQTLNIGIYRKSNNTRVDFFNLSLLDPNGINLAFPVDTCTNQILQRVTKLTYTRQVNLTLANYSDPAGYYIVWDRCCRNEVISNIVNPGDAGNAFYLEFPALQQGGTPFINSSPAFSTPQASYLCLNGDFTFDFGATDADGDNLVYSMDTPFNGSGTPNDPRPFDFTPTNTPITPPLTYSFPPSSITWGLGFSATNAIPSSFGFPLTVNPTTGMLSGKPSRTGTFVFSVKCEEFRGGIKIGEVKRDYQVLIKNCQELNPSPLIRLQLPNGSIYQENTLLDLDANKALCLNLQYFDTPNQNIRMTYLPLNDNARKLTQGNYRPFRNANNQPISGISINSSGIGVARFCWKECLYSFNGDEIFEFGIIGDDQGCPVRGIDTLFVKMIVRAKFNNPPGLSITQATPNFDIPTLTTTPLLTAGQEVKVTFQATDKDNDSLSIFAVGRGFAIDTLDITFTPKEGRGRFTTDFIWRPSCRFIKVNGQNDQFIIDVILREKKNTCNIADDTLTLNVNLKDVFSNVDNFLPANTFTPNGDGVNDVFQMEDLPQVADFNRSLPLDNCLYQYNGIKIYNRWGKTVFESDDRKFKWDGSNLPTGVYYYVIDYTTKRYKGNVNIMK